MLRTTIAGSLPKPEWLAEPNKLWAPWKATGEALAAAKRDATLLWLKRQEDAGIDIVTDGEQSRQHFVHGFLEQVEGIDFDHKVEMGIRNDRYKAMVPTVTSALRLAGRVHETEARLARAHTGRKLKFTLPGPMTLVDTIADRHYGDKVALAMAFADLLNQEARALEADGVDTIQFDEPAFNVYMDEVATWGIQRAGAGRRGAALHHRGAYLLRLRHQGEYRLERLAGRRMAAIRADVSGAGRQFDRPGFAGMPQRPCADAAAGVAGRQGCAGRRDRCRNGRGGDAGTGRRGDRRRRCSSCRPNGCSPAPIAAWRRCRSMWRRRSWWRWGRGRRWRGGGWGHSAPVSGASSAVSVHRLSSAPVPGSPRPPPRHSARDRPGRCRCSG